VGTVVPSTFPIEYPKTADDGLAIIYYVADWPNAKAAFDDVSSVTAMSGYTNIF